MSSNFGPLCRELIGGSLIIGSSVVFDNKQPNLTVKDAHVRGDLRVSGNTTLGGDSFTIQGDLKVAGDSVLCGDLKVIADAALCGNTLINKVTSDLIVCGNVCTPQLEIKPDWSIGQDPNDSLNFKYQNLSRAIIDSAGLICAGTTFAVGAEVVIADGMGEGEVDPDVGLSVINGDGSDVVNFRLANPSNTKSRTKQIVAATGFTGNTIINLVPDNLGGNGNVITFDTSGAGATLVWAAGNWWCVGTCDSTPVPLPPSEVQPPSVFRVTSDMTQMLDSGSPGANLTMNIEDVNIINSPGTWLSDAFTITSDGWMHLNASTNFAELDNKSSLQILVNGEVKAGHSQFMSTGADTLCSVDDTLYLEVNDEVKVLAQHFSTDPTPVTNSSFAIFAIN